MKLKLIQNSFYLGQALLGLLLIGLWLFLRPKDPETGFQNREADRPRDPKAKLGAKGPDLGEARIDRVERKVPLALSGIRIDGPPHEILGVAINANTETVQRAYRDLMKRYHPDLVGRPGSREWQDAQQIAEAINRARSEMMKNKT